MTNEQFDRLDKCYYPYDIDSRCEEETIEAVKLICGTRFDLYAILLYIDHKVKGVEDMAYATNVYKERTRAVTNFKLSEVGNEDKNTFDDFVNILNRLIDDFRDGRFDKDKTLIPVDKNYVLIDGAHRVSCAAYFGKEVKILRFLDLDVTHISYNLLEKREMPIHIADAMALEASKWHDDMFVMFFWPMSFTVPDKQADALHMIHDIQDIDIIYEKECTVTYNALRNLMIQIYGHMDWVGNIDNDFQSTYVKADEVWHKCSKCRFILMRAPSCEYVTELKARVRNIFDMGLASVHTTDNIRETRLACNALFNQNSFHFITVGQPTKFKNAYKRLQEFKNAITTNGLDVDNFIIDSGTIMAVYGVRDTRDLDYYALSGRNYKKLHDIDYIEEHDIRQKSFYRHTVSDLIWNPAFHFCFDEMKFVALEELLVFKQNRLISDQDIKDIKDIKELLNDLNNKKEIRRALIKARFKRNIRIIKYAFIRYRNGILKFLHVYKPLRVIYHKIKTQNNSNI